MLLVKVMGIIFSIYIFGMLFFIAEIYKGWRVYKAMLKIENAPMTPTEMQKLYIIRPIIFMLTWPLTVFILRSPIELFHKLFESYGQRDYGAFQIKNYNGFKSFWNDLTKGKNRYVGYAAYSFSIAIKEIPEDIKKLPGKNDFKYVNVELYIKDNHIICQATYSKTERDIDFNQSHITRFQLDGYIHTKSFETLEKLLEIPEITVSIIKEKIKATEPFFLKLASK